MKQVQQPGGLLRLAGRSLLRLVSPGGRRGLSILIYHRVLPTRDPLFPDEVTREDFARQMAIVAAHFTVLPLLEGIRRARAGTLPPRAACITFDDGYADNCEIAMPVLQEFGLTATFFIATGFLNGGRMWNDSVIECVRRSPAPRIDASSLGLGIHPVATVEEKQAAIGALIGQLKYVPMEERLERVNRLVANVGAALPDDIMLTTEQLLRLRAGGMDIGAHTVNHPILARIPIEQARREVAEGRATLEQMLGEPIPLFAFPNGKPGSDYGAEHVALVKELGFEGAVSTSWGGQRGQDDLFQLPRFTPWDRSSARFTVRMAKNLLGHAVTA